APRDSPVRGPAPYFQAAVIDHATETTGALTRRPADFVLAGLGMRRGPAKSDQRHPLPFNLGHIAQVLSSQPGTMQIMLFLQQFIEPVPLLSAHQADNHFAEKL